MIDPNLEDTFRKQINLQGHTFIMGISSFEIIMIIIIIILLVSILILSI